jgi:hypothetical protein
MKQNRFCPIHLTRKKGDKIFKEQNKFILTSIKKSSKYNNYIIDLIGGRSTQDFEYKIALKNVP